MIRKVTAALFAVCLVTGVMWGGTDGRKYQNPAPMHPDTSAPDAWGYTWVKSTEPGGPTFRWVDISTRGTLVTGLTDDNVVGPFDMLFTFPYYWYTGNRFKVGSNGYITFDPTTTAFAPNFGYPTFPNTAAPNDLIAALVGDLVLSGQAGAGGQCYYWTNGLDSLVVSYINVTEWEQVIIPTNTHTFQIILNKADSSITYQYGLQRGRYNTTNNLRLCIGIENATGQIGRLYTFTQITVGQQHPLMPDSGLAIKFKRTVNTGLQITDAGIVGGLNTSNLAKMIPVGKADTMKCVVKNFGTANLTNVRVTYLISRALETYRDTVFIASLTASEQVTVTFPRLFTPTVTGSYSARFEAFVPNDVGPGNNVKVAEIVSASFAAGQSTRLQFESGTVGGSINWIGGGGMGVAFDPPVYPVRIETVFVNLSSITTQPMLVEILDGSSGSPGTVLATRSVTAVVGMNTVLFTSDSVRITGGRFFVGARGQMAFSYETTAPISYRSWEYTGGWAPYRSGDLQDVIIRATVTQEAPVNFAWTAQTSGTTVSLRTVKALSSNLGWVGGASGTVLRTTNGGTAWSSVGGGAIGTNTVHTITALDQNNAIVGSSPADAFIYRTTNGGGTWTQVYTQVGGFIDVVHMFNATNGIALGDPVGGKWTILRTSDGGATWVRDTVNAPVQVGTEAGWINSFHAIGTTHFWFGTNSSKVYRSTDGGLTWSSATTAGVNSYAVWFNDTQNGVAAFTDGTSARSSDGGATWTSVPLPGTGTCYGVAGVGGSDFWVSKGANVYKSTDWGTTWTSNYTSTIGSSLRHLNFVRSGGYPVGWVVSSTGGIARYATTTVGVEDDITVLPQEFTLMQNYPNPFNPTTNIRYSLPRASFVTVGVYNILGQEVATVKNEIQNVGTHEVIWYGKNNAGQTVASGVYFYRLRAKPLDGSNTFDSFRKMVLLK